MESGIQTQTNQPREGIHTLFYALFSVILGYLFVRWTFGPALGIGIFIFTCLFLILAVTFRAVHTPGYKGKFFPDAAGFLGIFLLGGVMLLSDNPGIKFVAYYVEIHAVLYWLYHFFGNREADKIDGGFFFDSLKAIWVMPFGSFGSLFTELFSARKGGKGRKVFGYVVLGLLVALIPTAIVLFLLMAGDVLFESFFDHLFENITEELFENVMRFLLSIPVSLYLFGALWSNAEHRFGDLLTNETRAHTEENVRFLHPVVSCTAVVPIIALYVLYLVLHVGYYFSAFKSIVPDGYTPAGYARTGFFELCAVAFLNLLILLFGAVFTKRRADGEKTLAWRITALILSGLTLALSASAISKMLLYIRLYGLTQKRVITMWAMCFLILTFVYVIIRQFVPKFNVWGWSIVTGIVMLLLLGYSNVDTLIARYNIDAWRDGKLDSVDVDAIGDLSDAVTPYLIELTEEADKDVANEAKRLLFIRSLEEKNEWCYENIPSLLSLKKVGEYEKKLENAGEQDQAHVSIKFVNRSAEPIEALNYAYRVRGTMVESGGVINADNSLFEYDDVIWLDDVFEKAVAEELEIEITIVLPDEEGLEHYAGMIYPAGNAGELTSFIITGDRYEGFRLETVWE